MAHNVLNTRPYRGDELKLQSYAITHRWIVNVYTFKMIGDDSWCGSIEKKTTPSHLPPFTEQNGGGVLREGLFAVESIRTFPKE
jgi:hypothetical protein